MFEFLYQIDLTIFYFLNHTIANPIFDKLFVLLTTQECWYITYAVLIFFLLTRFGAKGRYFVVVLIIGIFLSDQISSQILKGWIGRIRPCHFLSDVRLLVPCGGGKSFPSSHAVNNFALAVFLTYFFRYYSIHFFSLAALIAISRVYVGVHYPSDIIGGAIIGYFIARLIIILYHNLETNVLKGKVY